MNNGSGGGGARIKSGEGTLGITSSLKQYIEDVELLCYSLHEQELRPGEVRGPAALLIWCQRVTQAYYPFVNITNMSRC